jgi:hypothetical protein
MDLLVQFLLTGSHPFGIFYCAVFGTTRWLADLKEAHTSIERRLFLSYLPALVGILLWTPAIRAARPLMDPIPWQPATTISTLQTILAPGIASLWPVAFFATVLMVLSFGSSAHTPASPSYSAFTSSIPHACIGATLAVWL